MTTDITQHTCVCSQAMLSRLFVVFYWFLSQGVVDWSQREGPAEEILGSILREKETRDRGPVMQIHQLFIYHLYTSISFNFKPFWDNFSIGGRLCPVRIIIGGSSSASHVWSSELGVTTEFPSSCNNFTWPADTDRQSQPAHNWTHENTGCFVKCGQEDPDMDIIIWRQNSIHGDSQPVKLDPRDVLNGRETDERV